MTSTHHQQLPDICIKYQLLLFWDYFDITQWNNRFILNIKGFIMATFSPNKMFQLSSVSDDYLLIATLL